MHPRSPYTSYLDFKKLAKDRPSLAPYVDKDSNVNFKDPAAVRELAKSLLSRDFGLAVDLPDDRLCPMVPNRLDYILWIQDLVDASSCDLTCELDITRPVVGLDIGTGASCIYPLLGCASRPSWHFIASDIDASSLASAAANAARNFSTRIQLHHSDPSGPLIPLSALPNPSIDFTMCNPPFYDSAASLLASAAAKTLPPSSACTGTPGEMVYEDGGELGFARRMLEESLVFRERVGWYTTLFGKLASVGGFVECLKREGVENWVIGEMVQGTTRRWVVAWSYGDRRVQGSKSAGLRGCSPPGPGLEFAFRVGRGVGEVGKEVAGLLEGLEMCVYKTDPERGELYGEVKGNVWSRAARRAAARGMDVVKDGQEEVKLGFLVQVGKEDGGTVVKVVWKRGRDPVLFESLCGMVKRKLVLEK